MLIPINKDDNRLIYPGYYNIHPIRFEVSAHGKFEKTSIESEHDFFLDDYYGRTIPSKLSSSYGHSESLPFHLYDYPECIIDEIRVPMRKIPVYKFEKYKSIQPFIKLLESRYPNYEILLRGQTKFYPVDRSAAETRLLYGQESVKEPSLLPSFARQNFNEFFIYNLWYSMTAMMLDDIAIDLKYRLLDSQIQEYKKDVQAIKLSPHFTLIALGIAQHYGLPSVGLDLTKDIKVASWFASHRMLTDNGLTQIEAISDFKDSTIFVFRCPQDQVFEHNRIKPKFINNTRPDRQQAWFSHTGWGLSKNQIAENLICAIRLDESVLNEFEPSYHRSLFPDRQEDLMLNFFLDLKESGNLKGEARRAFEKIYKLYDLHL